MTFTVISIGNTALPAPLPFSVKSDDVDTIETAQDGSSWRKVFRTKKRSVSVEWDNLTPAGLQTIRGAIAPASFQLNIDYSESGYFSFTAFAEDFNFTVKRIRPRAGVPARFSASVTFTEL